MLLPPASCVFLLFANALFDQRFRCIGASPARRLKAASFQLVVGNEEVLDFGPVLFAKFVARLNRRRVIGGPYHADQTIVANDVSLFLALLRLQDAEQLDRDDASD